MSSNSLIARRTKPGRPSTHAFDDHELLRVSAPYRDTTCRNHRRKPACRGHQVHRGPHVAHLKAGNVAGRAVVCHDDAAQAVIRARLEEAYFVVPHELREVARLTGAAPKSIRSDFVVPLVGHLSACICTCICSESVKYSGRRRA